MFQTEIVVWDVFFWAAEINFISDIGIESVGM